MTSQASHGAAGPALGYLYQCDWPLIELLRRAVSDPDAELTLELLDDVSWSSDGTASELLQVKHHINTLGHIGDMDVDMWRTFGVWMDAHRPGDPQGPTLTLVTTETAAERSAASFLRPPPARDSAQARALLEAAAAGSQAEVTKPVREVFLGLADADRAAFVERIYVLDHEPAIGQELDEQLKSVLYWGVPQQHTTLFIERLWGWWHRVVIQVLRRNRATISALDLKAKIDDMRNAFAGDNLPTLVELHDVTFNVEESFAQRPFVEQLRWIAFTATLLQKAMIDYYRAYTQSALWLENNLIAFDELATYEATLRDEWERQFELMRLALPAEAAEATQQQTGRELFRLVSEQSAVRMRAYGEVFFIRGKLHELADDGRVGWHRDFHARLEALLVGG